MGLSLLRILSVADERSQALGEALVVSGRWSAKDFDAASRRLADQPCVVRLERLSLDEPEGLPRRGNGTSSCACWRTRTCSSTSRSPTCCGRSFTSPRSSSYRSSLQGLSESDAAHLAGDIKRAHELLISQWLTYIRHLQKDYPYLFSLAVRTNPFNPEARVEIA